MGGRKWQGNKELTKENVEEVKAEQEETRNSGEKEAALGHREMGSVVDREVVLGVGRGNRKQTNKQK